MKSRARPHTDHGQAGSALSAPARRLGQWSVVVVAVGVLVGTASAGLGQIEGGWAPEPERAGLSVQERTPQGDPERGEERFGEVGCNGCHTVEGVGGRVGPDLTDVGARPSPDPERWPTTREYLRSSIQEPDAYVVSGYTPEMPDPDALGLSERDVNDLVAYLLTLTGDDGEG